MFINTADKKVNITVTDMVFVACRRRERFKRFDNALKDDPAFAISVVEREEKKAGNTYYPNTTLSCFFKLAETDIALSGKASVLVKDGEYTVDVVKSVRYPVRLATEAFVHDWLCEAKCLAFILASKHALDAVTVRVSVFHTETLERKNHIYKCTFSDLEAFFKNTLAVFSDFFKICLSHIKTRNEKSESAGFPFQSLRDGQKEISKEIFSSVKNKHNVIINAPTGLGKTVAALYPSLKAQGRGLCDKVFYLTAKNSGSKSVADAIKLFEKAGYDTVVSFISAKARVCTKRLCSPQTCSFPKGHHERVMSAVLEISRNYKIYTGELITEYAAKYNVCPFMLEMELVWFADLVVCDYNYVFDPEVAVKISSCLSGNDVILVDEAHNLIDRIRGIFSAEIDIGALKKLSENQTLSAKLKNAVSVFLDFVKNDTEDSDFACEPLSSQSLDGFEREINALFSEFQEQFEENNELTSDIKSLSDSLKAFVDLLTLRSDKYLAFYNDSGNPEIFMVNTSDVLFERSKELGNLVLFSATLFPEEYYKYMLGARDNDAYVSFPSPFDSNNLLVLGYPLSTKYSDREETVEDVARAIWSAGRVKQGNYISFFPSYKYMAMALNAFARLFPDERIIYQKSSMTDEEKADFISSFDSNPNSTLYAFAVLGGVFSEGIDLVGDRLSGAVVVGLGSLPPSRKGVLVSNYFSDLFFDGEKFAYHYPGLNKVFQAGGRVIRSETDKGFLLIIDDRFLTEENIELLPESWSNVKKVKDNNSITEKICDFWQNSEKGDFFP